MSAEFFFSCHGCLTGRRIHYSNWYIQSANFDLIAVVHRRTPTCPQASRRLLIFEIGASIDQRKPTRPNHQHLTFRQLHQSCSTERVEWWCSMAALPPVYRLLFQIFHAKYVDFPRCPSPSVVCWKRMTLSVITELLFLPVSSKLSARTRAPQALWRRSFHSMSVIHPNRRRKSKTKIKSYGYLSMGR